MVPLTVQAARPVADVELSVLVDTVARPSAAPFGAYVFGPDEPGARMARALEAGVFEEAFGNDPQLLAAEYGPYEESSVFFVVIDHVRRMPAGAVRLVVPGGPSGLKSVNDLAPAWCEDPADLVAEALPGLPAATTWDWATLAVDPEYRSAQGYGLVSMGLYQSVVRTLRRAGGEHLLTIVDRAVYRMLRLRFAEPFVSFAPARPYLGSTSSCPAHLALEEWGERLAIVEPELHSIIFEARGIEPALDPLDPDTALDALPVPGSWSSAR